MPVIHHGDLRVDCTDTGSGICVIFVPGVAGSKDWFCYQTSGLSDHYRVVSCDLRTARETRGRYDLDLLADDLLGLMDALHIDAAAITGHSLGGLVALRFALAHPDRCLALILASTAAHFPNLPDSDYLSYLLPVEVRREGFFARLIHRLFGAKLAGGPDQDQADPLARAVSHLDQASLDARLKLLRQADLTPVLAEVESPALVVAGSGEPDFVLAGSQALDEMLPDSSIEIIEGADQYYFYNSHDRFNEIVADFVSHRAASF